MLNPTRIAAIYAATPSEAAINRSFEQGARNRSEALQMVFARRVRLAERHDAGEHYGAASYSSRVLRDQPSATDHEQQALRRARQNIQFIREIQITKESVL